MGGCCSSTTWELETSEGWPLYFIRRSSPSACQFTLEIVNGTSSTQTTPALTCDVQLYMTSSGRLHAGSLHPTDVTFADKSQRYDLEAKRLTVDGHQGANITYQRTVTQKRHICPYDVAWRLVVDTAATGQSKTPPALPHELSVDNTKGRVAVFHGPKPKDDEDPKARAADLVACVACTHGQIPSDWSCNRVFELRLHPRLEKQASETPGGLSLILAMIVEGFWSQVCLLVGVISLLLYWPAILQPMPCSPSVPVC